MYSVWQRFVRLFDLRMLVWLPGFWLIAITAYPPLLTQLDRYLFFTGITLSPSMPKNSNIHIIELTPEQQRQLVNDPANASELVALVDVLSSVKVTVGVLLTELPRLAPLAAEELLQNATADNPLQPTWQEQQQQRKKILRWLASPNVVLGSNRLAPQLPPQERISVVPAAWENYYEHIAWLRPGYAQPALNNSSANAPSRWRIWPTHSLARHSGDLTIPLVWQNGTTLYPMMALGILRNTFGAGALVWAQDKYLTLTGTSRTFPLSMDGSVVPIYQTNSPFIPTIAQHSLHEFLQQTPEPNSILLIGARNDPAMLELAGLIQSVQTQRYYTSPWWFYAAEKFLFLLALIYLLVLLPKVGDGVAFLSTAFLLLLFAVVQLGWQITQMQWLPLGVVMQYLLLGYVLMALWRKQQRPQQLLMQRHHEIACQLGRHLLQQGQLEQAVAALSQCPTSERVLQLLYDIGGQHERKRRITDALAVYKKLKRRQRDFKDVSKRIAHLEVKQFNPMDDKDLSLTKTIALSDPHSRPQFGRYQIERELGRGAMGVVYLGHDPQIARRVAIKTLDYSHYDSGELAKVKARFFREAEAAGRMQHPNIVTIYDVGEEHDLAFIAMDYIPGQPLSDFIKPAQLLPTKQVYQIVAEVAEALAYAHRKQIVHRDIKPANIIFHRDTKKVTVTDFGIARITGEARTQTGEIVGSPLYMSPEQVKGQTVGSASDTFSLGVTFFQLLCGELPFSGDNIAGLSYQIIHSKHKNIRDLRPQLPRSASRIINKALQKEPSDRYKNASEMARSLQSALQKDFT